MTDPPDRISEMDLLAYVDGHLEPARREEVEGHLAEHPGVARRIARDIAINDGIRQLFEAPYLEAPPPRLTALLQPSARRVSGFKEIRRAAAAVILVLLGIGGGWIAASSPPAVFPVVEQIRAGTLAAFNAQGRMAEQPVAWLAERIRQAVRAPQLAQMGYQLTGQGVVGTATRPAVRLVYVDRMGRGIEIFMQPRWADGEGRIQVREANGRALLYWIDGPVVFALTGDVGPEKLRLLAEAIRDEAPAEAAPVSPRSATMPVASEMR